jgi:superfamily II DNA/RNA helicase
MMNFLNTILETIEKLDVEKILKENIMNSFKKIFDIFMSEIADLNSENEDDLNKITKYSSQKVNCLLELLKCQDKSLKFHSIIFVERKQTAQYLDIIFQRLSLSLNNEWNFLRSNLLFVMNI